MLIKCLKQGIKNGNSVLNRVGKSAILSAIFVLNRVRVWGIIGGFFWNDIAQSIRDKPSKKCLKKHFYAGTWLNTNESISLL